MEPRKNPQLDIYRHSGLFFQIGLLITLVLVVSAFEWKTSKKAPEVDLTNWQGWKYDEVKIVKLPEPKPPKPKVNVKLVPTEKPDEVTPEDLTFDQLDDPIIEPETIIESVEAPEDEAIEEVTYADQMPEPKGGFDSFYRTIAKEMKYPRVAQSRQVEGKVYVSFLIDEFGEMKELSIAKGIGSGCDEEALRVLKEMPPWKPGRKDGKMVRVRMIIPIVFKLK